MDLDNKYGVLEIQRAYLTLVQQVHWFCVENNILYSLSGGSLLGAIRHGGFIPWDDDMDIVMTREYYNKLMLSLNGTEEFEVVYDLWVPRIKRKNDTSGLYIDIFIFDNALNNIMNRVKIFILKIIQGMMKKELSLKKFRLKDKLLVIGTYVLGFLFTNEQKRKMYNAISQIGNKKDSQFFCKFNDSYQYLDLKYPVEILSGYKTIIFEDIELNIMEGYDVCLKVSYGDYMKPPEEKDRKPMHSAKMSQ